jgi:hypothetical protein
MSSASAPTVYAVAVDGLAMATPQNAKDFLKTRPSCAFVSHFWLREHCKMTAAK